MWRDWRVIEYKIVVPETHADAAWRWLEDRLRRLFGGFHVTKGEGVWNGRRETVRMFYVLVDDTDEYMKYFIPLVSRAFRQDRIYFARTGEGDII
jgi:hypothetical protein